IEAGAKEYIPLPADAEIIAAILAAVAEETSQGLPPDDGAALRIVGRPGAHGERGLLPGALRPRPGKRTPAAKILGISIRTLPNKLTVYAADGVEVHPPNSGEIRGAA